MNAHMCEQSFGRTNMHADRQTDGRTDALRHACMQTHERMYWWIQACTIKHLDARTCTRTDRRTDGRTDSHIRNHARAHAHTQTVACLHAHTMHSGTYARTDSHTHTCSYGGKHPSTNMEVRSKKLEVRNKKCRACIDERTHVRTNIWMHEHARGQTDGRTDSNIRPHARVHANTRMHALMNAGLYDQTGRTDGLTQTPSRTRACTHTNGSMLTHTHDALRYIRMDGQTYAHLFVRRQTPKFKHGS